MSNMSLSVGHDSNTSVISALKKLRQKNTEFQVKCPYKTSSRSAPVDIVRHASKK